MGYNNLTEAVEALKGGEQSAFQHIYDESSRYIYYTILKTVQDKDIADDILQETYLEIFRSISSLKEAGAFKGWAAVIAQNKISRHFRKKTDSVFSSEEEMDTVLGDLEEADSDMLPEDAVDNKETQRLISGIIDSLPDGQKEAVVSFYYNQMSISEISGAMDVSENTVKTWLSRGKKKIKQGVLELEKKHGTKLYTVPFVVVLAGIFTKEAEACELPAGGYALISSQISAGAAASASAVGSQSAVTAGAAGKAAATAAGTAVKTAGINWGVIAAAGLAISIAGGTGVTVGSNLSRQVAQVSHEEMDNEVNIEEKGALAQSIAGYAKEEVIFEDSINPSFEENINLSEDSDDKEANPKEEDRKKKGEESDETDDKVSAPEELVEDVNDAEEIPNEETPVEENDEEEIPESPVPDGSYETSSEYSGSLSDDGKVLTINTSLTGSSGGDAGYSYDTYTFPVSDTCIFDDNEYYDEETGDRGYPYPLREKIDVVNSMISNSQNHMLPMSFRIENGEVTMITWYS